MSNLEFDIQICRLCMELIPGPALRIRDSQKLKIQNVLPHVDLSLVRQPLICLECSTYLSTVFDFQRIYNINQSFIKSKMVTSDGITIKLKDVIFGIDTFFNYLNNNGTNLRPNICRTCFATYDDNINYQVVDYTSSKEENRITELVRYTLPDIILDDIFIDDNLILCESCIDALNKLYNIRTVSEAVEGKIKLYCHIHRFTPNSTTKVNLSCVKCLVVPENIDNFAGNNNENKENVRKKEFPMTEKTNSIFEESQPFSKISLKSEVPDKLFPTNKYDMITSLESQEKTIKGVMPIKMSLAPSHGLKVPIIIANKIKRLYQNCTCVGGCSCYISYHIPHDIIIDLEQVLAPFLEDPTNSLPYMAQLLIGLGMLSGGCFYYKNIRNYLDAVPLRRIFNSFCLALTNISDSHIFLPLSNRQRMNQIKDYFLNKSSIPNVIGALNISYFFINTVNANSVNKQGENCVSCQLLCDHDSIINNMSIWDIYWSNGTIWNSSKLRSFLNKYAEPLTYVVADEKYVVDKHLLTSLKVSKTSGEKLFNLAVKSALRPANRCARTIKKKFRILTGTGGNWEANNLEEVKNIVTACIVLNNMVLRGSAYPPDQNQELFDNEQLKNYSGKQIRNTVINKLFDKSV